ncbi:MAG: nucleotidyltransferase [Deltaproteobacteria bacterium]|nr:nucleotidyltransferase [Deltaproteobacteria bacterium]
MVEILFQAISLFEKNKIDYCLIGGLAMMLYGGRANTVDIDFYVLVEDLEEVRKVFEKEKISVRSAGEHQLKIKIKGVQLDILYADHYLGDQVVKRAKRKKLGKNYVKIATPEDLIVLKTLADRSVDRRDIEELRELFEKKLDEKYIKRKLEYLRNFLS